MKEKGTRNWIDVATAPGSSPKAKVTAVDEGKEYEFRVIAVNKAGNSEPSDPSRTVMTKPRHLAPYIDRKNLAKKVIRVGEMLSIEAGNQAM